VTKSDVRRSDPQPEAALGDSRARVLGVLQDAGAALGVADVAEAVGLHPNTTRFHLDGLVDAGLVQRATEERETPGRPRTLYSARPEVGRAGPRSYRLLAEILTSYLAGQSRRPGAAALTAGTEWGRFLARRPAPFRRPTAEQATAELVRVLDEVGFAPEAVTVGRNRRVLLHHCPFREAAEQHREVVCSVHLGLMRGLLEESGAPLQADRLDPFVEPSLCVTHLAARARKTS
jgi:predicted ArsR family transcriptional regulator